MPAGHTRQPQTFRTDAGIVPYSVGADSISALAPCPYYIRPAGERKIRPGRAIPPNKEHRFFEQIIDYCAFSRRAARISFWMAGVVSTFCIRAAISSGSCFAGSCSAMTEARYSAWDMAGSNVRA